MTFEPTTDMGLVRSIVTHPKIWPAVTDDFSPAVEEYQPVESPALTYLLVKDGDEVLGLFMLVSQSPVLTDVHTCLLPCAWGKRATEAATGMFRWIFEHTKTQLIGTQVPAYNRLAYRFGLRIGMTEFGRMPKSYQKNNELHDQILLGVSREEFSCRHCHS